MAYVSGTAAVTARSVVAEGLVETGKLLFYYEENTTLRGDRPVDPGGAPFHAFHAFHARARATERGEVH
jgi:hypothetical protein